MSSDDHSQVQGQDHNQAHEPLGSFRFFEMPPEIRESVLSYTDLVAPMCEVERNPSDGLYWRYIFNSGWGNHFPHILHGNYNDLHGRLAGRDGGRRLQASYDKRTYRSCWEESHPSGCFCRSFHAAHSTVFNCTCWAPPTSIFLVNRAMRTEAMDVFYRRNKIIIAPPGATTCRAVQKPPERLPISTFLSSSIPQDGLKFLQSIEVVFPPFGSSAPCAYCPAQSPQWLDWIRTIKFARKHLDLPKVVLRVYFASWIPRSPFETPQYRVALNENNSLPIQQTYLNVIEPLKELGSGLKCFYVHLANPLDIRRPAKRWLPDLEAEAEKYVMGNEYDAIAVGKGDGKQSVWLLSDMERRW